MPEHRLEATNEVQSLLPSLRATPCLPLLIANYRKTLTLAQITAQLKEMDEALLSQRLIDRANEGRLTEKEQETLRSHLRERHALVLAKYELEMAAEESAGETEKS